MVYGAYLKKQEIHFLKLERCPYYKKNFLFESFMQVLSIPFNSTPFSPVHH